MAIGIQGLGSSRSRAQENQIEQRMENEVDIAVVQGVIGISPWGFAPR